MPPNLMLRVRRDREKEDVKGKGSLGACSQLLYARSTRKPQRWEWDAGIF
jgi:hypothetical protein